MGKPSTCPVHSATIPDSDGEDEFQPAKEVGRWKENLLTVPITFLEKGSDDDDRKKLQIGTICIGPSGTYDIVEDKLDPFEGKPSTCPVHSATIPDSDGEDEFQPAKKVGRWKENLLEVPITFLEKGSDDDDRKKLQSGTNPTDFDLKPGDTTVYFADIPNDYTGEMFLEVIHDNNCKPRGTAAHDGPTYDFFYLPTDFVTGAGLGWAALNLGKPTEAMQIKEKLEGYNRWTKMSKKVLEVTRFKLQ